MKKIFWATISFLGIFALLPQTGYAQTAGPPRLREVQTTFVEALILLWSLSVLYFTALVIILGFQQMFSFGDSNKTAEVKTKFGQMVTGAIIVFTSWIVVNTVVIVLQLETPEGECFSGSTIIQPVFRFFFATACN